MKGLFKHLGLTVGAVQHCIILPLGVITELMGQNQLYNSVSLVCFSSKFHDLYLLSF